MNIAFFENPSRGLPRSGKGDGNESPGGFAADADRRSRNLPLVNGLLRGQLVLPALGVTLAADPRDVLATRDSMRLLLGVGLLDA
jgi:hypothetical protein